MSPTYWTFLFELLNFLLLALILGRVFFRPVRQALEDRRQKVATQLAEAANKLAEAGRIRVDIESRQRKLGEELDERRKEFEQTLQKEVEEVLTKSRQKAQQERERLVADLQATTRTHHGQLARAAALAAGRVVEQLLSQIDGPALQAALERAACRQLASLNGQVQSQVMVESQTELSENTRASILGSMPGLSQPIDFRVLDDLGPGLRIVTTQGLIDATAGGLAKYAEQVLAREMEAVVP